MMNNYRDERTSPLDQGSEAWWQGLESSDEGKQVLIGDATQYERPRVMRLGSSLRSGATVLLRGPQGSGMATVADQWAQQVTGTVLRLTSPGVVIPDDVAVPELIVLTVPFVRRAVAEAIRLVRVRWPESVLLVVSPWGWPDGLAAIGIEPDVVITGRTLAFSTEEVAMFADSRGVSLSTSECYELVVATAGQPLFVSRVIRAAERYGGLSQEAIQDGCDAALASVAAGAFQGRMPWSVWEAGLLTASSDNLSLPGLGVLWELIAEEGNVALRTLRSGGLLIAQSDDLIGFPWGIRRAARRRIESDLPEGRAAELQRLVSATLVKRGYLGDALALTARASSLTAELVAEHWRAVSDLPAARVRKWLRGMVRADTDPRVLFAHVRALVDATHRGYPGYATDTDRELAAYLLDLVDGQAGAGVAETGPMAEIVAGAIDRANGHHSDALRTHIALAEDTTIDPRDRVIAQLHAGLTAIGLGDCERAQVYLRGARTGSLTLQDGRLSALADELHALTVSFGPMTPAWRQMAIDTAPRGQSAWPLAADAWRLSIAVSRLDIAMIRNLMDRQWSPVLDDPVGVHLLDIQARVLAHAILGTPRIALNHLALIDTWSRRDYLTDAQADQLRSYKVEGLLAAGEAATALDLIEENYGKKAEQPDVEVNRARALLQLGEPSEALPCLTWTLHADRAAGGRHLVWIHVLLSMSYADMGDDDQASSYLQDALTLGAAVGLSLPFARQGIKAMSALLTRADDLHLETSVRNHLTYLHTARDRLIGSDQLPQLTSQEQRVVALLARNNSVPAMAAGLHVSPNTVKTQLRNIYRKFGVRNRAEAVRMAHSLGFADNVD